MTKTFTKQFAIVIFLILFSFLCWFISGKGEYFNYILHTYLEKNDKVQVDSWFTQILKENWIKPELLNEAYDIISKNYYSFSNTPKSDLISWMIKWLVTSLGDKHSEYFNLDETKKFNETLSWDFEWIWAVIQKSDFWVIVERLIAWAPAKEAWILSGDIIIKANDIELKNLSLFDAVNKIKWPAWTIVSLDIIRPGEKEIIKKEVIRKKINIPSVDSKVLDKNIWYVMLSIFWEKTWDEFKTALSELQSKNINSLIIDLRDNGGGYLETAVSILSNFVEKDKVLVTTKEKNPLNNKSYFSYGNANKKIPIIILVNGNSASASEITAGALKDYNIALIVWEKTYGKWSVQEPFILSDGSEMKITIAKWFTPLDHWIDWIGINPDIEVKFIKEDYEKNFDRQLDEAKKIMSKLLETKNIKTTIDFYNNLKKEEEAKKLWDITSSWTSLTWTTTETKTK